MDRAYSLLTIKAVDEERRTITGIATTPAVDRAQDIVVSEGAQFKLPIPLLWQHRSDAPIGKVTKAKVTKNGIQIEAQIAKIEEPGNLKDRLDEAWQSIKSGLVGGLSIGFRGIEMEQIEDGFGIRFLKWLWLELSAVTIPANQEATIQTVKNLDAEALAATGSEPSVETISPASREQIMNPKTLKEKYKVQTTLEKVKAFEAKRQAKAAAMAKIMEEAGDETLDASTSEEYDTLKQEVTACDEHLDRLNDLLKTEVAKAKPVLSDNQDEASESRGSTTPRISIRDVTLPKGIGFARLMRCKALAKLDQVTGAGQSSPLDFAKMLYPSYGELHDTIAKTAVAAGTTTVSGWAAQLVNVNGIFADFVEYLRPMTIIGQFGTNGIPGFRRVPFRTILASQTAGTTGYWVGEGQPKPVSKPTFASTYLLPYKVAAISVATMELLRDSSPSVEAILRDDLARAVAARIDVDFLDPQKGADSSSPASISNGVTVINSSGRDADSVRADLVSLMAAYVAANNLPTSGVWVMSAITALQLSLLTNALGQPEFPGITMTGGRLQGLPVITSEFLGYTTDSPTEGRDVFLVNANDIWLADDGGIEVAMSSEAALQMDDAPTNASGPSVVATSMVSMWQTNSVAFRAERSISWAKRRAEAVQQLAQVEWGEASGVNV